MVAPCLVQIKTQNMMLSYIKVICSTLNMEKDTRDSAGLAITKLVN